MDQKLGQIDSGQIGNALRASRLLIGGLAIGLVAMVGCRADPIPCQDRGDLHVICGVDNPEDLAALPGSPWVVFGQGYGVVGEHHGSISAINPSNEEVAILFEGGAPNVEASLERGWGESTCPSPPTKAFSPHGIDVARQADGRLRLLAVNHGGRESIEVFEVKLNGAVPEVVWRGCVIAPERAFLNDVVGLPDTGFLTTQMMEHGSNFSSTIRGLLGMDTGFVFRWHPDTGFQEVPGSKGALPNGIQISRDGQTVFLDLYLSSQIRIFDLESGRERHTLEVSQPDNLTWTPDGRLLVASHLGGLSESLDCMRVEEGACAMSFEILSIDPETYEMQTVFAHEGAPMGAGTAALDIGDELLIGSFASDRLLRVPLRKSPGRIEP